MYGKTFEELEKMTKEELAAEYKMLADFYVKTEEHVELPYSERSHLYSRRDLDDLDGAIQRLLSVWSDRGYTSGPAAPPESEAHDE